MRNLLIISFLIVTLQAYGQQQDDSLKIVTKDYRGYIMSKLLDSNAKITIIHLKKEDVYEAENALRLYLDSFCKNYPNWFDDSNCHVFRSTPYFRQYTGYKDSRGDSLIDIDCILPELVDQPESKMKNPFEGFSMDACQDFFFIKYDMKYKKVLRFENAGCQ